MKEIIYFIIFIIFTAVAFYLFVNKDIIIKNHTLQAEKIIDVKYNSNQTSNILKK